MMAADKDPAVAQPGFNNDETTGEHPGPVAITQTVESERPVFKEGGYGWAVVAGVFILNMHTWGLNSSFAVFLAYYLRTGFFPGVSALQYAFVGGLSISMSMLFSPLTTVLVGWKKCGTSKTIFLGVILQTIGFLGASFAAQLWQLLLSQGVAFGLGMGFCFVASAPVPAQWFDKKRSLANGIAAAGSGFGGLCYSIATNAMIQNIGLAWTFRVIAIICIAVNGVAAFVIKDRNAAIGSIHVPFSKGLLKRGEFILYELWMIFSILGYVTLVFSIVDYCQAVGLSPTNASLVGAMFNLGQGLGRPPIGLLSDRYGRLNVSQAATGLCTLLCLFFWIFGARTLGPCIVFALLCGPVAGAMWACCTPVCAEVVGLPLVPSALSMTWLALVLPSMFSEVIGLQLKKPGPWGYVDVQIFVGCMYAAAFFCGWTLRAWKVQELENARLAKEEREMAIRNDAVIDSSTEGEDANTRSKAKFLSLKGFWVITKV